MIDFVFNKEGINSGKVKLRQYWRKKFKFKD